MDLSDGDSAVMSRNQKQQFIEEFEFMICAEHVYFPAVSAQS